jgi:hypothetical protein
MMLTDILLALAMALPASKADADEGELERRARLATVAHAITEASERATCINQPEPCTRLWPGPARELAALLLSVAWHESALARNVHAGECKPWECDAHRDPRTGRTRHRAASLWQLHASGLVPPAEWRELSGTDAESTRRAAWAAARVLAVSRNRCGTIEGAVAQYGTGRRCTWKGAASRLRTWQRLLREEVIQ